MKKLFILCLFLLFFSFHTPNYAHDAASSSPNSLGHTNEDFADMDQTYQGRLPWENNPTFLNAMQINNTPIKMAAFKATLHDPILAEGFNINLAATHLAGKVIKPGETFSQNQSIGPYTQYKGYQAGPTYAGTQLKTTIGGGVCKIASVLYNVAVLSDLPIIMRFPHSMTVPYVPPGQDATVYYGVKDLRFLNNTDGPIMVWSQKVDNTLYVALYGQVKPPKVTWHHDVLKHIKFWVIKKQSDKLPPGEQKTLFEGQDGFVVKSWVTVEEDGKMKIKNRGKSYYNPFPSVVEYGINR